jgi:hypothetical protein
MRPKLLSEILRQNSPRRMYGKTLLSANRYSVLNTQRDSSPADSVRSEISQRSRVNSQSVKRKGSHSDGTGTCNESLSYANITGANSLSSQQLLPGQFDEELAKVRSLCDKVGEAVQNPDLDPALVPVFSAIYAAILGMSDLQVKIVEQKAWKPVVSVVTQNHSVQQVGKKPRQESRDSSGLHFTDLGTLKNARSAPSQSGTQVVTQVASQEDEKIEKFKEAVRDAEKSTLIFNLNLGNVPIMNQDTMSTKATIALSAMAAKQEKATGTIPSDDTVIALEDVLSVATDMQFYGRKTKSYSKKNDPQSGVFCTVPVRYNFSCKEDRIEAETVLRDKCKVSCATPYHPMLRESIKQVVDTIKADYPGNFVRVAVDTNSMALKISRRPMVESDSQGKKIWSQVGIVPIPTLALDTSTRTIPDGFKVENIPRKTTQDSTGNNNGTVSMDTTSATPPPSEKASRSPVSGKAKKNLNF